MRRALRYMFLSCVVIAAPSFFSPLRAQDRDRCGTVAYSKTLHPDDALYRMRFEQWLSERMLLSRTARQGRQKVAPYSIPVVVHIVHNGEAVGVGSNISDAQVQSQIRVLNDDFRRMNADTVNTPPEFAAVAGSLDIRFVLAKQDPEGLATTGIVRVNGGRSSWTMNDNYDLKKTSYWPAEEYMNIWVCNLTDGYVGYAQMPESTLQGMENSSTNRLTDGIVVWYKAFGSVDDGAFTLDPIFDKGRTATHETGHFLGLIHIWGDDTGCTGSDYVGDTPNQAASTNGCPTHPRTDSCGDTIMFQNYLDYTDDDCMNLFTQGQVGRMVTVLENSLRRNSLLTSPGLQDPAPLPNDLGIRSIVSPGASICDTLVTPVIELRNYGSNTVTSARIRFVLDGVTEETLDFPLSLAPLETANVSFSPLVVAPGNHGVSFQVLLTNGGTDGGSYNDLNTAAVIVPAFAATPFSVDFSTPPSGWVTYNPDGQITWQIVTAPGNTPTNQALKLNCYSYEDKVGEVDAYISPVVDLSSAPTATLAFDVAYARFQSSNDRLKVVVLADCQTLYEGTVVYNKAGDTLKTAPPSSAAFTPASQAQWRRELISLSAFTGLSKVQVAFVGINDWGNNIYLDNISLFTQETWDVALTEMMTPSVVTCEDQIAPVISARNAGSVTLTSFDVDYAVNGAAIQTFSVNNLDLSIGQDQAITLPVMNFTEGINKLFLDLKNPNGFTDSDETNDERTFTIVVNKSEDRIPLRENFESAFTPAWTIVNPAGGKTWETVPTNAGTSLYFNAYDDDVLQDEAWLVSPVLDFTQTTQASMLFDLSYAASDAGRETLDILASTDCGTSYQSLIYSFPQPAIVNSAWLPQTDVDWKKNIAVNLTTLAGSADVRIAFVVRNGGGNNLYLDNIEFYTTANPDPIEIGSLYSVYGYDLENPEQTNLKITFNLPERQDVRFTLLNAAGAMETDGILTDVLNQTYPLNLSTRLPPGVYFIRVQIGQRFYTSKVLVF